MGIFLIILAVTWISCSILSYGLVFAYFQREWPTLAKKDYTDDKLKCLMLSLFGPFSLIASLIMTRFGRHGIKWN